MRDWDEAIQISLAGHPQMEGDGCNWSLVKLALNRALDRMGLERRTMQGDIARDVDEAYERRRKQNRASYERHKGHRKSRAKGAQS
jgi:hypothetical protein